MYPLLLKLASENRPKTFSSTRGRLSIARTFTVSKLPARTVV